MTKKPKLLLKVHMHFVSIEEHEINYLLAAPAGASTPVADGGALLTAATGEGPSDIGQSSAADHVAVSDAATNAPEITGIIIASNGAMTVSAAAQSTQFKNGNVVAASNSGASKSESLASATVTSGSATNVAITSTSNNSTLTLSTGGQALNESRLNSSTVGGSKS
jgi:hypothetical protein